MTPGSIWIWRESGGIIRFLKGIEESGFLGGSLCGIFSVNAALEGKSE